MKKQQLFSFGLFLSLLLLWEGLGRFVGRLAFVLPPPTNILHRVWETPSIFLHHTSATLQEMVAGLVLALLIALPIGWVMAHRQFPRLAFQPLFLLSQCLPVFTLAPLMVLWFDWSSLSVVIPTTLMIFFPLCLNIYQGIRSTPQELVDFFAANQASSWTSFRKLELPWSLPHLFSGLRIAAAVAGIAAVGGEWAGAQRGLGTFMQESRRNIDIEAVFGALFALGIVSSLLYALIALAESIAVKPRRRGVVGPIWQGAACLLLLALLLCATPVRQKGAGAEVRLLLDWLPNPNHVALYAGLEEGIFAEEGIDLRILKLLDPSDAIPYLTTGQAEFAVYYCNLTLRAIALGAPLRIVGKLIDSPLEACLYRKGIGIERIEDLYGRRIGHFADPVQERYIQRLEVPVEPVVVNFDLNAAFSTGSLDATLGVFRNIEPAQMEALGIDTGFFPVEELGVPDYPELLLVSTESCLAHEPTLGSRFRRALAKSIAFAQTHPDLAFEHYLKCHPEKQRATQTWEKRAWMATLPLLAKSQKFDPARWEEICHWLYSEGVVNDEISLQKVLKCPKQPLSSPTSVVLATSPRSTPS